MTQLSKKHFLVTTLNQGDIVQIFSGTVCKLIQLVVWKSYDLVMTW